MNIKVATFNLFQFVSPPNSWYTKKEKFTDDQWTIKTNWIKKQITDINADIIAFQEVFSVNELKKILNDLNYPYFEIVDTINTSPRNELIYTSCLLAIASKYPISNVEALESNKEIENKFNFENKFEFARKPIKATISINSKELLVYVFHLKSNRLNEYEYVFNKDSTIHEKLEKNIYNISKKNAKAQEQRICEVSNISFDIQKELEKDSNKNIIVMGDLNDKEHSLSIDLLTNKTLNSKIKNFNTYDKNIDLSKQTIHLQDAFYIFDKNKQKERIPTSYYKNKGNVIDYIFVSKSLEDIINYKVFNNHLKDNHDGSLLNTDHAIVFCEIKF